MTDMSRLSVRSRYISDLTKSAAVRRTSGHWNRWPEVPTVVEPLSLERDSGHDHLPIRHRDGHRRFPGRKKDPSENCQGDCEFCTRTTLLGIREIHVRF